MKQKLVSFTCFFAFLFCLSADARGSVTVYSRNIQKVVENFARIADLSAPSGSHTASTTCGYIFPNDPNKFGCTGTGAAAKDIVAACRGAGEYACTGSGSNRKCTCAFD